MADKKTNTTEELKARQEQIRMSAEKLLYYNNLLIQQCDGWLSAEEGLKNVEKRIKQRKENEKAETWALGALKQPRQ
jgi:hypothetical protein